MLRVYNDYNKNYGKQLPDSDVNKSLVYLDFDSPEEALIYLATHKLGAVRFTDDMLYAIEKLTKPVIYHDLVLDAYVQYENYIYLKFGRFYSYIGQTLGKS